MGRRELLRALDPVHGRGESEYQRLAQARALSEGLEPQERFGAHSAEPEALYCSLNRDAISAVRRGHHDTAIELREHAERIEQDTLAPWVEAAWAAVSSYASELEIADRSLVGRRDWIDIAIFGNGSEGTSEVAAPVWEAAQQVAEVRSRYQDEAENLRLSVARVWRIDDVFSELRPEGPGLPDSFAFLTQEVFAAGLHLGDPVVVRHEELAPGILLTTLERALDRSQRIDRMSGREVPRHLEELLDSATLPRHSSSAAPLRLIA